jgi:hypothetical protein
VTVVRTRRKPVNATGIPDRGDVLAVPVGFNLDGEERRDRRQSPRGSGNVTARSRGPADTLLAACVLGFATAPLPLLLLAGRSEWGGAFGIVASTVVLLASGALVYRYVIRRAEAARTGAAGCVVEAVSWVVVIAFLIVGSGIKLLVGVARAGVVADSFLLLTLLELPVVILRRTAVERRLARLPRAGVRIGATAALVVAGLVALIDLATPARFPGGRKSRHADDPIGSLVRRNVSARLTSRASAPSTTLSFGARR